MKKALPDLTEVCSRRAMMWNLVNMSQVFSWSTQFDYCLPTLFWISNFFQIGTQEYSLFAD